MLKLRSKNNKLNAVWLVEPKVTIGRSATNDLVIDNVSIADHHAEVLVSHEKLTLVNLTGEKTVFLNQKAIESRVPVKINDEITIGDVLLEVADPKLERPTTRVSTAPRPSSTGWALKANSTALSNRVFPLQQLTVIGRSNECDITLAAAHLSRRHVQLSLQDGVLSVKDLGSANGTYLNGERVTEARVMRGDELRFDTLSFGVIGPVQDLDKTTVRNSPDKSSIKTPLSEAKLNKKTVTHLNPELQKTQNIAAKKFKEASAQKPQALKNQSIDFDDYVEPHTFRNIVIGIIVVAAVAAGVAYQQGYLPL